MRYGEPSRGAGREAVPLPQRIAVRWFARRWQGAASLSSIRAVTGGQEGQSLLELRSVSSPALLPSLLLGHPHVPAIAGTIRTPPERLVSGTSARGKKTRTRRIAKPDRSTSDMHQRRSRTSVPIVARFALPPASAAWPKRAAPSTVARRNPEMPAASAAPNPGRCRSR
jgi:hypothetical protein